MWRPPNWENPHKSIGTAMTAIYYQEDLHKAFEAGADAMLEGLKANSIYLSEHTEIGEAISRGIEMASKHKQGWVVFIPDEEDE